MKLFTTLLVFASSKSSPCILTSKDNQPPTWIVPDSDRHTLDVVRDGFYNISGIDRAWHPFYDRPVTHEFFPNKHKEIYIVYSAYLEAPCKLVDTSYKWTDVRDLYSNEKAYRFITHAFNCGK